MARGLDPDVNVRVFNNLGEVVLPLEITDAVPPGVVASEKGAWIATSPTGQTISALVSAVGSGGPREGRLLQRRQCRGSCGLTPTGEVEDMTGLAGITL